MDLSILIINWNSAAYLKMCLASIFANVKDMTFEVIVVDNASYDGCGEMVQNEYPKVRFIQSPENLGFAGANNLAARYAEGRVLLILNPDTEIVGDGVQRMLHWIDSVQDAGAVVPKIVNSDLSIQTSCVRAFPTILNEMLDADWLRTRFPNWSLWGTRALQNESAPARVEAVSGACFMMNRAVFERLGGFSEGYFMYGEDTDLCFRARQSGLTNYYIPWATVIHHGGKSSSAHADNQFSSVMMKESLFIFMRMNRGYWYAQAWRASMVLAALGRLGIIGTAMVLNARRRQSLRNAFVKWQRIFRWAIGLEPWAKQGGAPRRLAYPKTSM